MKKLLLLLAAASGLPFASNSQTVVQQWDFDEDGSGIASLISDQGTNASFFSAGGNVETAFDGGYTVNRSSGFSGNIPLGGTFNDANTSSITVSVTLASFDFTAGTDTSPAFQIRLGDSTIPQTNVAVFSFARNSTNMRLQVNNAIGSTATVNGGTVLGSLTGGTVTYGATFDFVGDTYTLWVGTPSSDGSTWGDRLAAHTGSIANLGVAGTGSISSVSWGWANITAGNNMVLDQVLVTQVAAIPEPSALAALAGLGALGFVVSRRRRG
jgi:hypothetical protein